MTLAITEAKEVIILSIEYAANGLDWARLYDNHALGWLVDETTTAVPPAADAETAAATDPRKPPSTTGSHAPFPIILGSLPVPAPITDPIQSPQWAKFADPIVLIPDGARFKVDEFFWWLATNGGARRPLAANFALSEGLHTAFIMWTEIHPDLVGVSDGSHFHGSGSSSRSNTGRRRQALGAALRQPGAWPDRRRNWRGPGKAGAARQPAAGRDRHSADPLTAMGGV
jgi:hypothetical protein